MTANVGAIDRVLRAAIGLGLIVFGLYEAGSWRWIALAGPVLIATALFRFCPAYSLLRISTAARAADPVPR